MLTSEIGPPWAKLDKESKDEKIKQAMVKQKFTHEWYPACWLAFIWYGPPRESGAKLPHLLRLQSLGDDEIQAKLVAMGGASRAVRKEAKKNIMKLTSGEGVTPPSVITAISSAPQPVEFRKIITREKAPYEDHNELINTLKDEIEYADTQEEREELTVLLRDALRAKRQEVMAKTKAKVADGRMIA